MTNPAFQIVADQLISVRSRALYLTYDLRRISESDRTASYAANAGIRTVSISAHRYLDATTRARDYSASLAWSRAHRRHPSYTEAVIRAFERAIGEVSLLSLDLELELARLRDAALAASKERRGLVMYSYAGVFAHEIDLARQRAFDSFGGAVDPGTARNAVAALLFGQQISQGYIPPGKLSRHLLAASVQIIPPEDRLRYEEEFRSELSEVAPGDQLMYTVRLLGRSWQLRAELLHRNKQATPSDDF